MSPPPPDDPPPPCLVIILSSVSPDAAQAALLAFRYAATAAAMDLAVEVHAVSGCTVRLLARSGAGDALRAQVRQATEHGASLYVCPLALAELNLRAEDLIDDVCGVRGAASLLGAGFAPGARFISF